MTMTSYLRLLVGIESPGHLPCVRNNLLYLDWIFVGYRETQNFT